MELKLENNLPHQLMPVEGVAAVVEDSIQEAPKASNQNPQLKYQLSGAALTLAQTNHLSLLIAFGIII